MVLKPSPELLDTFWGYYYATGDTAALQNIISLLPWSTDRDDVQRLTLGGMAKYTLAENASRDTVLLATIKTVRDSEPKDVQPVLDQVIEAADNVDVSHVRSEMLASLDELKRKGSATKRNVTFWGQVGEGAIAAGCIGLAVASVGAAGIPVRRRRRSIRRRAQYLVVAAELIGNDDSESPVTKMDALGDVVGRLAQGIGVVDAQRAEDRIPDEAGADRRAHCARVADEGARQRGAIFRRAGAPQAAGVGEHRRLQAHALAE